MKLTRRRLITGFPALIGFAALPKNPDAATIINPFMVQAGGAAAITVDAADFDGTNDYQSRGADLTGIADGKEGIVSFWCRLDGGDGSTIYLLDPANQDRLRIRRHALNWFQITGKNATPTTILDIRSTATYTAGASWRHVFASWKMDTAGARFVYVNDVDDTSVATFTDDTIDYAGGTDWVIGADGSGANKFNGCIAEFFFHTSYLDISVESNRRKFITSDLKPADLGSDGSTPLGVQPLVYCRVADGAAASTFATNLGTGGNFSITGTLDTCSSSPSD